MSCYDNDGNFYMCGDSITGCWNEACGSTCGSPGGSYYEDACGNCIESGGCITCDGCNNCDASPLGCIDATACNYNSCSIQDDGSCIYQDALGYCGGDATQDCAGTNYSPSNEDGYTITDSNGDSCNVSSADSFGFCCGGCYSDCLDGSGCYNFGSYCSSCCGSGVNCDLCGVCGEKSGCTDYSACNTDSCANYDDGSCIYDVGCGCGNPPPGDNCGGNCDCPNGACDNCGTCGGQQGGCTDPDATNYNQCFVTDDGSCNYAVYGCMDGGACNYNSSATVDDGTCTFALDQCHDCDGNCICSDCGLGCGSEEIDSCGTCAWMYGFNGHYDQPTHRDCNGCLTQVSASTNHCSDPAATNYSPYDGCSTGVCEYNYECGHPPLTYTPSYVIWSNTHCCTDPDACGYPYAARPCFYPNYCGVCNGSGTPGCSDPLACNYDPEADVCPFDETGRVYTCIYDWGFGCGNGIPVDLINNPSPTPADIILAAGLDGTVVIPTPAEVIKNTQYNLGVFSFNGELQPGTTQNKVILSSLLGIPVL